MVLWCLLSVCEHAPTTGYIAAVNDILFHSIFPDQCPWLSPYMTMSSLASPSTCHLQSHSGIQCSGVPKFPKWAIAPGSPVVRRHTAVNFICSLPPIKSLSPKVKARIILHPRLPRSTLKNLPGLTCVHRKQDLVTTP